MFNKLGRTTIVKKAIHQPDYSISCNRASSRLFAAILFGILISFNQCTVNIDEDIARTSSEYGRDDEDSHIHRGVIEHAEDTSGSGYSPDDENFFNYKRHDSNESKATPKSIDVFEGTSGKRDFNDAYDPDDEDFNSHRSFIENSEDTIGRSYNSKDKVFSGSGYGYGPDDEDFNSHREYISHSGFIFGSGYGSHDDFFFKNVTTNSASNRTHIDNRLPDTSKDKENNYRRSSKISMQTLTLVAASIVGIVTIILLIIFIYYVQRKRHTGSFRIVEDTALNSNGNRILESIN